MTVTIGSGAVLICRGFRLSLVQAKPDWCLFLIPPGDQPEVLMAESRASAIAEAQRLIDDRLAKSM